MLQDFINRVQSRSGLSAQVIVFGIVGCIGLASDMAAFTLAHKAGLVPLVARLLSLVYATWVTWTLNRSLTFAVAQRASAQEASRYAAVTLVAQGMSYLVFAVLVTTAPAVLPQLSMIVGAVAGASISFVGHKLFSFAPAVQKI